MKVLGINRIVKFSFNGMDIEEFNKQEEKIGSLKDYREGSDHFEKTINAIEEQYKKDSKDASEKFFSGRRQKRVDEIYLAKKGVWMQDVELFTKEKENRIAAIQAYIDSIEERDSARDEINKLKAEQVACQRAKEIAEKQQASNKKLGFNKLGGYEKEKSMLQRILINNIIDIEAGLPAELPNGILFYGPTGTGKTTLAEALSQQVSDDKEIISIDMCQDCYDIMDELEVETRKARRRFDKEKKITLIVLDEIETIAHQDSEVLDALKAKMVQASEDKCVYIMTTNNPTLISKDILTPSRAKYKIEIDLPDFDNTLAVVEHYFSNIEGNNIDYKKIAKEFYNCKSGKFSNSGIEEIYGECCKRKQFTTKQIIDIIKASKPNVSESELKEYQKMRKEFLEEN